MKTLHVTFGFLPDPPGGTELYVKALAQHLETLGVEAIIAAPGRRDGSYRYEGLRVRRFGTESSALDLSELYGEGDPRAAAAFERILDTERPDVVHQHALTAACSVQLVRRVRQRGLPVVFTYHTPTTSCQRGTLMEWGRAPCDGRLDVARCTACTLHGLGVGRGVSQLLSRTPEAAGELLSRAGFSGGAWTALRMSSLVRRHHDSVAALFSLTDLFVALTPWVHAVLRANGVPESRIVASPHGVPRATTSGPVRRREPSEALRVAHLGRLEPSKGTRLLIQALRAQPSGSIELDLFGIIQSAADANRGRKLRALAEGDARIRFLAPLSHADVVPRLADYDLVAVPSQGLETGPLVVLEAFAAGVPVIGSAIGGIADKVTHGVNGLLVEPHDSAAAWGAALTRCAHDAALVAELRRGVRPPRSMADVARQMQTVYRGVLDRARGASLPSTLEEPA
jgi:glycosyltransferase involved in cell wall biosynthesis